jgi:hypothetical protein
MHTHTHTKAKYNVTSYVTGSDFLEKKEMHWKKTLFPAWKVYN